MILCYKMRQALLKTATTILLQNVSGVLLQNTTVIRKCVGFITKCDSYYRMRCFLQNVLVKRRYFSLDATSL